MFNLFQRIMGRRGVWTDVAKDLPPVWEPVIVIDNVGCIYGCRSRHSFDTMKFEFVDKDWVQIPDVIGWMYAPKNRNPMGEIT